MIHCLGSLRHDRDCRAHHLLADSFRLGGRDVWTEGAAGLGLQPSSSSSSGRRTVVLSGLTGSGVVQVAQQVRERLESHLQASEPTTRVTLRVMDFTQWSDHSDSHKAHCLRDMISTATAAADTGDDDVLLIASVVSVDRHIEMLRVLRLLAQSGCSLRCLMSVVAPASAVLEAPVESRYVTGEGGV